MSVVCINSRVHSIEWKKNRFVYVATLCSARLSRYLVTEISLTTILPTAKSCDYKENKKNINFVSWIEAISVLKKKCLKEFSQMLPYYKFNQIKPFYGVPHTLEYRNGYRIATAPSQETGCNRVTEFNRTL